MADEVKYKVADDFKATVELYSGQTVTIDMMKISTREWKSALKASFPESEEMAIIAKATGLATEHLEEMPQPDYRLIIDAFVKVGTQPLTNPT